MTATISTKGQFVIPAKFRRALHLRAGDEVSLSVAGGKLIIQREAPSRARLVTDRGRKVLVAPSGAPPMTTESVKAILSECP